MVLLLNVIVEFWHSDILHIIFEASKLFSSRARDMGIVLLHSVGFPLTTAGRLPGSLLLQPATPFQMQHNNHEERISKICRIFSGGRQRRLSLMCDVAGPLACLGVFFDSGRWVISRDGVHMLGSQLFSAFLLYISVQFFTFSIHVIIFRVARDLHGGRTV